MPKIDGSAQSQQNNGICIQQLYSRTTHLLKENYGTDEEPESKHVSACIRQVHRANEPS